MNCVAGFKIFENKIIDFASKDSFISDEVLFHSGFYLIIIEKFIYNYCINYIGKIVGPAEFGKTYDKIKYKMKLKSKNLNLAKKEFINYVLNFIENIIIL